MLASRASLVTRARFAAVARSRRTFATSQTLQKSTPSEKICVIPFAQRWQDAKDRLHIHGLLASAQWANVLYAAGLRLFGTGLEPIGRELGLGQSLTLRSMKAAYYPVWRVDLIAEGSAEPSVGGAELDGWMAVREGYVPGNAFAPLSYISYAVPPLPDDLPTYDRSRDLYQLDGEEIVEVPFTVDPMRFAQKVRERIGTGKSLDGARIEEAKWKEKLLAAYPLYFPIYLAEWEVATGDGKRSFTMILDAHDEDPGNCRVTFPPPGEMRESGRLTSNYYVNPAPFLPTANVLLPVIHEGPFQATSPAQSMAAAYTKWMSPPVTPGGGIAPSPTLSVAQDGEGVKWDDPRIQRWSGAEREQNGEYMEKALSVATTLHAMKAMASLTLPPGTQATITRLNRKDGSVTEESKPMSRMRDEMGVEEKRMNRELDQLKPDWLRDYETEKLTEEIEKPEQKAEQEGESKKEDA